jgi:7,8-dihydroneopterin aldolase/epimerase/oxygenase
VRPEKESVKLAKKHGLSGSKIFTFVVLQYLLMPTVMGKIILEEMEFFAYHGCFQEEQVIGNRFVVSLEFETNTAAAEQSDQLHDTVNYQKVYNLVRAEMEAKSYLLEHLTRRIVDSIKGHFREISWLRVKVSKMNPPMGGKMRCVSLELED